MQTQAFAKYHKLDIVRVPYRDGTQALNDLTENRIQLYSSSYAVARPAVEAGKIRPIAVTATQWASALLTWLPGRPVKLVMPAESPAQVSGATACGSGFSVRAAGRPVC